MRTIREIASEVRRDWKKVYYGAVPYLEAMGQLDKIDEDGRSIVTYFLSNATTWRGETARRVKAELKAMLH
jgi:hypothetical protein